MSMRKGIRVIWPGHGEIDEIESYYGIDVAQLDDIPKFDRVPAVWPRYGKSVKYVVDVRLECNLPDEVRLVVTYDQERNTAQVIARAEVTDHWGSWALFRVAQIQGEIDLLLAPADAPVRAPSPYLHLLASVDPGVPHRRAQSPPSPSRTPLAA